MKDRENTILYTGRTFGVVQNISTNPIENSHTIQNDHSELFVWFYSFYASIAVCMYIFFTFILFIIFFLLLTLFMFDNVKDVNNQW